MEKIHNLTPVILVKDDMHFLPYALESVRGWFSKYIIYDVGSTDGTLDVIDWFVRSEGETEFIVRKLPFVDPVVQGTFRNAMIAEAQTDFYMILDADEAYNMIGMSRLRDGFKKLELTGKPYGLVRRVEMSHDLRQRYDKKRSHHRVYHRKAIWKGTHPGEEAVIPQIPENEFWIEGVECYHFHNCTRSTLDEDVPKRLERRGKPTYHPGKLMDFNLLDEVPMLRKPVGEFLVNPELEKLQKEYGTNKM